MQVWCDVDGQAGRVGVPFLEVCGVALANPRLGVRIRGRARTDGDALARALAVRCVSVAAHGDHRNNSSTNVLISRVAALSGANSRASRSAATLSAKTIPCRTPAPTAGSG